MKKTLCFVLCLLLFLPGLIFAHAGVYYEIFTGAFYDSDGDGRGDIGGIIKKTEYLKSLGIRGVWLTPLHPSPSYHKYDVLDYYAVDESLGSMETFEELLALFKKEGISLIMDLVINHSSNRHPWFLSAIESLQDTSCQTLAQCGEKNPYVHFYQFSKGSGAHKVPGTQDWYYAGNFGPHMPDFNLDDPLLRKEIEAIIRFWLEKGVSGFRLDATTHYYEGNTGKNSAFLRWIRETAQKYKPNVYIVAEAWTELGTISGLWESGIDSLFNFPFHGGEGHIVKNIRSKKGKSLSEKIEALSAMVQSKGKQARDAIFLGNHDTARISGVFSGKDHRLKQAAAIYLSMPGIPFVYYGEEIGMSGSGRDENKRMPFVWGEEEGMCRPFSGTDQEQRLLIGAKEQTEKEDSLLSFYKAFIRERNKHKVFINGKAESLDVENSAVCAYRLRTEEESLVVLHNLSDKGVSIALPDEKQLVYAWKIKDEIASLQGDTLHIPPYSGCILK